MLLNKKELLAQLLDRVRANLAGLTRTQADASDAATHSENRAEHAKDTRATEQSYLARGLAERVEKLRDTEARLAQLPLQQFSEDDSIALTAVVRLQEEESGLTQLWWLVPVGGGLEIADDAQTIRTLTPSSPMGRAIMGLAAGDEGVFQTPRGERRFVVLEVC